MMREGFPNPGRDAGVYSGGRNSAAAAESLFPEGLWGWEVGVLSQKYTHLLQACLHRGRGCLLAQMQGH